MSSTWLFFSRPRNEHAWSYWRAIHKGLAYRFFEDWHHGAKLIHRLVGLSEERLPPKPLDTLQDEERERALLWVDFAYLAVGQFPPNPCGHGYQGGLNVEPHIAGHPHVVRDPESEQFGNRDERTTVERIAKWVYYAQVLGKSLTNKELDENPAWFEGYSAERVRKAITEAKRILGFRRLTPKGEMKRGRRKKAMS